MEASVTLPTWFFILLLSIAALLVLDRILLPGVRWYLRRRVNRVIEEVNTRLDIEIRPFQLTRRQTLVDQLMLDDKVVASMKEYAEEQNMPREVVQAKVERYAKEIAPSFNAFIYFRFGYWLAKTLSRMLYRVRVGFYDQGELRQIDPESSIVFVMNHRSNMDYVLVSFLIAERAALSYAVGEWARIWPLQTLIKSMGAFFVRRQSRNQLYRRVLERYVNLATRAGVCQAVFIEGGLTRDGKLREPKQGFLDYMLRDYRLGIDRNVVFVPVGINYDRVIEDMSLVRRLKPEVKHRSTWFVIKTSLRFGLKTLLMSRKKRWLRFGYASVNFGKPLSVEAYCHEQGLNITNLDDSARFDVINDLSQQLMTRVANVMPILPVALVSEVVLASQDWCTELEIKGRAAERIAALRNQGAPIRLSPSACEDILSGALTMMIGRGFVDHQNNLIRAKADSIDILKYYANSIKQWRDPSLFSSTSKTLKKASIADPACSD